MPAGWFRILDSRNLEKGTSKQVSALGLELAVFRTESGKIAVLDAYCPHLGANLAAGGNVEGETLHCPFHGWQFDVEGDCVKIPYCDGTIPSNANVKKYHSLETNSNILFWFVGPSCDCNDVKVRC
jgi:cholesterol 7-dehydrogenase